MRTARLVAIVTTRELVVAGIVESTTHLLTRSTKLRRFTTSRREWDGGSGLDQWLTVPYRSE